MDKVVSLPRSLEGEDARVVVDGVAKAFWAQKVTVLVCADYRLKALPGPKGGKEGGIWVLGPEDKGPGERVRGLGVQVAP